MRVCARVRARVHDSVFSAPTFRFCVLKNVIPHDHLYSCRLDVSLGCVMGRANMISLLSLGPGRE